MTPYQTVLAAIGESSEPRVQWLRTVLELVPFPGDFDPSDREKDYVLRKVTERFGHDHVVTRGLWTLMNERNLL